MFRQLTVAALALGLVLAGSERQLAHAAKGGGGGGGKGGGGGGKGGGGGGNKGGGGSNSGGNKGGGNSGANKGGGGNKGGHSSPGKGGGVTPSGSRVAPASPGLPLTRRFSIATLTGRELSPAERGFVAALTRCCAKSAEYAEACVGAPARPRRTRILGTSR